MDNLFVDIYTDDLCDPDLVDEGERMEIKAATVKRWLAINGLVALDAEKLNYELSIITPRSHSDQIALAEIESMIEAQQEPSSSEGA